MKTFKQAAFTSAVAPELPDSVNIADDADRLSLAILTLAVSCQLPRKSDLTPDEATSDILQIYRAVRKVFLRHSA